jgi:hypothetical protein
MSVSLRSLIHEYGALGDAASRAGAETAHDVAVATLEAPLAAVRPIYTARPVPGDDLGADTKPEEKVFHQFSADLPAFGADLPAFSADLPAFSADAPGPSKLLNLGALLAPITGTKPRTPIVTPTPQIPVPLPKVTPGVTVGGPKPVAPIVHPAVAPGVTIEAEAPPIGATLEEALAGARPLGGSTFELGSGSEPGPDLVIPTEIESRVVVEIPGYGYIHRGRLLRVAAFLFVAGGLLLIAHRLSKGKSVLGFKDVK